MIEFIYLFMFRCLSGAQNGFGYAGKQTGRTIATGLMIAAIVALFLKIIPIGDWLSWVGIGWLAISFLGTIYVERSFKNKSSGVHLGEALATYGVLLSWVAIGGNIIYIALSVYPSLLIHKGLINIGSGLKFWDHRTDDKTGKTYTIKIPWKWLRKLLNKDQISVPRFNLRTRISIAVVSIMIVIINAVSLNWKITFKDFMDWL